MKSKVSESLIIQSELEYSEPNDEFYDALVRGESFEGDSDDDDNDDDDDDDDVTTPKVIFMVLNHNYVIQTVILLCSIINGDPIFCANFYAGWKGEVEERIMGHCRFSYEAN